MTNEQLWLAIGIPSALVLLGILQNHFSFNRIENRLTAIEADLRKFYQFLGEHSGRIDALWEKWK